MSPGTLSFEGARRIDRYHWPSHAPAAACAQRRLGVDLYFIDEVVDAEYAPCIPFGHVPLGIGTDGSGPFEDLQTGADANLASVHERVFFECCANGLLDETLIGPNRDESGMASASAEFV